MLFVWLDRDSVSAAALGARLRSATRFESLSISTKQNGHPEWDTRFLWLPNRDSVSAAALGQGAGKPSTGRFSYTHPFESLTIQTKQKQTPDGVCFYLAAE